MEALEFRGYNKDNHKLKTYFLFRRSNAYHTPGTVNNYKKAYKSLEEARKELRKLPESESLEKLIEYESRAAYECWSIFKKTFNPYFLIIAPRDIIRFIVSPWYFCKGALIFLRAKKKIKFLVDDKERTDRLEQIHLWVGDIFYYYAKLSIILFKTNFITKILLEIALPFYDKAAKRGNTYHSLRRDEVKTLLGQVDPKVIGSIEQYVHYYKTTEDNLGIGNALCVRALTRRNEMKKAVDDLDEAERAYLRYSKKGKTSEHKSGLMLVVVYRRLIGIISMRQAIATLTKLMK